LQHRIVQDEAAVREHAAQQGSGSDSSIPAVRKGVVIASDSKAKPSNSKAKPVKKCKGDSAVGGKVRSGAEYYDKWEKLAQDELEKLDKEPVADPDEQKSKMTTSQSGVVLIMLCHSSCDLRWKCCRVAS
jgi:hypothetical protein